MNEKFLGFTFDDTHRAPVRHGSIGLAFGHDFSIAFNQIVQPQ